MFLCFPTGVRLSSGAALCVLPLLPFFSAVIKSWNHGVLQFCRQCLARIGPRTYDREDGRMEVKFSVSCRYEHEAEDAQNGVDEEKMKDYFDAKIVEWSGGVMGVISQPALWACT